MSGVREWSLVICFAALSATMLQSMVPNGSMERMARFVIGAFVICALIAPVSRIVPQLRISLNQNSRTTESGGNTGLNSTVGSQYRAAAEQSITGLVYAELKHLGVKYKNVQVMMDTDANGSISITKIIVELPKESSKDGARVSSSLEKTLGIKTEVVSDEG